METFRDNPDKESDEVIAKHTNSIKPTHSSNSIPCQ